jgi:hypothetical protein
MENWRCKNLVFPRQTRNMAPIVGGTFKTLLHTHTHTYSSSFKLPILTLDSSHKWVQTSWVFSCSWALHMIDWKCVFWHANSDIHMHHKHMAQNGLSLLGNESYRGSTREGRGGGVPRGGDVWCVLSNNVGYLPFLHMIVWGT